MFQYSRKRHLKRRNPSRFRRHKRKMLDRLSQEATKHKRHLQVGGVAYYHSGFDGWISGTVLRMRGNLVKFQPSDGGEERTINVMNVFPTPSRKLPATPIRAYCKLCGGSSHLDTVEGICGVCARAHRGKVTPDSCDRCGGFGLTPECPQCGDIASFRRNPDEIIPLSQRSLLERMVQGALTDCIHQHGPITKQWLGSASKRVISAIKNYNRTLKRKKPRRRRY